MRSRSLTWILAMLGLSLVATAYKNSTLSNPIITQNLTGTLSTYSTSGAINVDNAFFQDLGTNGRTCNSCHQSAAAWSITPAEVKQRFNNTKGMDPIFRPVDGANCPSADVSNYDARRAAYSMLMEKGLIRVSMPVPPSADFQITAIDDPHACPQTTAMQPAMYRRPLPSTNLPFLTTVMWDGRESPKGATLVENLTRQGIDATLGHAEAAVPPTPEQVREIVAFEIAMFTAQATDFKAGDLSKAGATGGGIHLSSQEFYEGINDVLGADPQGKPFDPVVFTTFKAWLNSPDPQKAAIARGEVLFNTFPITITGVAGLNDLPGLSTVNGTCSSCHDSPGAGNHSVPLAIDIGIADYPARPGLNIAGLPVYTVRCVNSGATVKTTDPGRAMITGKCSDIGKTKGPVLRGLSARPPYFHNGAAPDLQAVVDFYNGRFNLNLSKQQKQDLVAFLSAL